MRRLPPATGVSPACHLPLQPGHNTPVWAPPPPLFPPLPSKVTSFGSNLKAFAYQPGGRCHWDICPSLSPCSERTHLGNALCGTCTICCSASSKPSGSALALPHRGGAAIPVGSRRQQLRTCCCMGTQGPFREAVVMGTCPLRHLPGVPWRSYFLFQPQSLTTVALMIW